MNINVTNIVYTNYNNNLIKMNKSQNNICFLQRTMLLFGCLCIICCPWSKCIFN